MTKPNENFLTIINDVLPRIGLVREGWRQTFTFVGSSVVAEILLRTWFKKAKPRSFKGWLHSVVQLYAQLSWVAAMGSAYYYREPESSLLGYDDDFLYSPADGKLIAFEKTDEPNYIKGPALQITFSSGLTDIHILRAPHAGRIEYIFLDQNAEGWTKYIGLRDEQGRKFLLGYTAPRRSILPLPRFVGTPGPNVTSLTAGQHLHQNEKIGVTAFGWQSRFTLSVPADQTLEFLLRVGQSTQAAMTVLARVGYHN